VEFFFANPGYPGFARLIPRLREPPAAHGAGNYVKGAPVTPRGFEPGKPSTIGY
ncbi:hypothetical protein CRG98_007392, partial [Punica granatum]